MKKTETITVEVPVLIAERIVSTVIPEECPWCLEEFEAAGEHKVPKKHKPLCPIKDLSDILDKRPR